MREWADLAGTAIIESVYRLAIQNLIKQALWCLEKKCSGDFDTFGELTVIRLVTFGALSSPFQSNSV